MQQAPGAFQNLFMLVMIFAIFFFIVILPQRKQEKERKKMLASLAKNDDVVTTGGVHGTIVNVKDTTVIIRIDENVKMEVEKNCIAVRKAKAA